jgi:hypothetical protein
MRGARAVDPMTLTQTDAHPAARGTRGRVGSFRMGQRRC